MSDIDTAVVDSLKALDPERPIREADITFAARQYKSTYGNGRLIVGSIHPSAFTTYANCLARDE